MSEKTFWRWLDNKMVGLWNSDRIENCSTKGIPDVVVSPVNSRKNCFIELKDWSTATKHPLMVEQKNFLETYKGVVLVRTSDREFCLVDPEQVDLLPLLSCNVEYVRKEGKIFQKSSFKPEDLFNSIRW